MTTWRVTATLELDDDYADWDRLGVEDLLSEVLAADRRILAGAVSAHKEE